MGSSFGQLALGLTGALIGAPFGLSAVGFSIGSALGGFLFAPDGPTVESPRLGDLDVSASNLGKPIPEHFGMTRTASNIIWSAKIKEVKTKTTESSGGKGSGPSQTTISYAYYASFAGMFGISSAKQLVKMWADGKIIYDATGATDTKNKKYKFRFHKGGDTKALDSLMEESVNRRLAGWKDVDAGNAPQADYTTIVELIAEAQVAADAGDPRGQLYVDYLNTRKTAAEAGSGLPDYRFTPAYRDLTYIVFDDMPLESFGNRIPNITAQIAWRPDVDPEVSGVVIETAVAEIAGDTTVPVQAVAVDGPSRRVMVMSGTTIRRFNYSAQAETKTGTTLSTYGATVDQLLGYNSQEAVIARATHVSTDQVLVKVSGTALAITGDEDYDNTGDWDMDQNAASAEYGATLGSQAGTDLFATLDGTGRIFVHRTDQKNIETVYGVNINDGTTTYVTLNGTGPMCSAVKGTVYSLVDDGTDWWLYETVANWGTEGSNSVFSVSVTNTILATGLLSGETVSSVFFDPASDTIYGLWASGTSSGRIRAFETDGSEIYDKTTTLAPPGKKSGMQRSDVSAGTLAFARGDDAISIDLSSGTESLYTDSLSGVVATTAQVYVSSSDAMFCWIDGSPFFVALDRASGVVSDHSVTLASVLATVCTRAGMTSDEYDVSALSINTLVNGYSIGRPTTGRGAIEKLLTAYFVDGVETDWLLKFTDRTSIATQTILEDELGAVTGATGAVSFIETRAPDYSLPSEVGITYLDPDRDYQQGAVQQRRVLNPSPVMHSSKVQNIEIPIVMTEGEMKAVAQRLLYLTWLSRDSSKSMVPWTYAALDPGDVIQVAFNDGRTLINRIGKMTMGANFSLEIESARSGDPVYAPAPTAPVASSNVPSIPLAIAQYSKLFVLDIPLLYDYHDTGRTATRYYLAVGSDSSLWRSAVIYESTDDQNYSAVNTANVDVTWGEVSNVLAQPRALWTTDKDNTITVALSVDNGDVTSTTYDDVLNNGANRAILWNPTTGIGEIVQFQTVTTNPDGTVTLSILNRGLRGTDYAVDKHEVGEVFIMLTDAAILDQTNELGQVGSTEYARAVSQGNLLSGSTTADTTFSGNDLKPWAPSNLARTDDGTDLTITWNRRTRVGGQWNMGSGVETVPVSEDFESYELYLLSDTATNFVDFDPTDVTTYSKKYTVAAESQVILDADLTTAGFTLAETVDIVLYQVSGQVGRGFPREEGLTP